MCYPDIHANPFNVVAALRIRIALRLEAIWELIILDTVAFVVSFMALCVLTNFT